MISKLFRWRRIQNTFRTIDDLDRERRLKKADSVPLSLRKSTEILLIDDEDIPLAKSLSTRGFRLVHWFDLESIEAAKPYRIVLCDLNGVGLRLAPEMQGAGIIRELKRNYPDKVIVAYTGGGPSNITEQAYLDADYRLRKDATVDEWTDTLDTAIGQSADPSMIWRKTRPRLLTAGITPLQLTLLEDDYVRSILNGDERSMTDLSSRVDLMDISADAKKIFIEVISAVAIKMITNS